MTHNSHYRWLLFAGLIILLSAIPAEAQRLMDATGAYVGRFQDGRFFDRDGSFIGRDDGRMYVYDASGSLLGRFDGRMFYDRDGSFMGRYDGGRLYGKDGSYLGRIDGGRIYGKDGSYQGRSDAVKERDLAVWWWFYREN